MAGQEVPREHAPGYTLGNTTGSVANKILGNTPEVTHLVTVLLYFVASWCSPCVVGGGGNFFVLFLQKCPSALPPVQYDVLWCSPIAVYPPSSWKEP